MEKTLQQQYNLIKEGKGNKDDFLKNARRIFPEFISPLTDYNTAVHILKGKSVLSEGISNTTGKKDWFKIFNENISEAVGVKDTKEYGDQNTFEKIDKEVSKVLSNQFDNKDTKNIDNVYGQSFLMGYYTEMKDPKNSEKSVDDIKKIVAKNIAKDINYYTKTDLYGVKDLKGEQLPEPKEPKGKYKSSGYGDMSKKIIKENQTKPYKIPSEVKSLEKHGVKIQIDPNNKVAPIKRIGVPVDLDDDIYDKIEDVLFRYNLKSKKYFIEEPSTPFKKSGERAGFDMRGIKESSQQKAQ